MAKVKMIKRLFKSKEAIICHECGKIAQEATNDTLIFVPYCGRCDRRIEDAANNFCGHCGETLGWN